MKIKSESLQSGVTEWMLACFGKKIASDKMERNHRFLEEAIELVQACEYRRHVEIIRQGGVFGESGCIA